MFEFQLRGTAKLSTLIYQLISLWRTITSLWWLTFLLNCLKKHGEEISKLLEWIIAWNLPCTVKNIKHIRLDWKVQKSKLTAKWTNFTWNSFLLSSVSAISKSPSLCASATLKGRERKSFGYKCVISSTNPTVLKNRKLICLFMDLM